MTLDEAAYVCFSGYTFPLLTIYILFLILEVMENMTTIPDEQTAEAEGKLNTKKSKIQI